MITNEDELKKKKKVNRLGKRSADMNASNAFLILNGVCPLRLFFLERKCVDFSLPVNPHWVE